MRECAWMVCHTQYDEQLHYYRSELPLAPTLRAAAKLMLGQPEAEICIRRHGTMVAWLKNNWRGELVGVDIYSPLSSIVMAMNPKASQFQGA